MRTLVCNRRGGELGAALAVTTLLLSLLTTSCATIPVGRRVSLLSLEAAVPVSGPTSYHCAIRDLSKLQSVYTPLTENVGLIQITTPEQWRRAALQFDWPAAAPDFSRGSVIGLVCVAGTPLNGGWPISIDSLRVHETAGLMAATVETGCYLADSLALAELAYVENLNAVLVVDLGTTRFYPE